MIGVATHGYVVQYKYQNASLGFVDKAKAIVVSFNQKIAQALASPAEAGLRLLSKGQADYQFNVPKF